MAEPTSSRPLGYWICTEISPPSPLKRQSPLQLAGRLTDRISGLAMLSKLSLSNSPSLRIVHLEFNELSSIVCPKAMACFDVILKDLSVGNNSFSGAISVEIRNHSSHQELEVLNLRSNSFVGTLPEQMMGMINLTTLDLSGNKFLGSIPFGLSKQNLSGELPLELAGLPSLQVVALQENKLSGDVPEGFSSLVP
ncbi:hypothetical protein NL676_032996 [Syzygium grande]|nr:hypothetical protein NL676_032996 [Syzygium grande]